MSRAGPPLPRGFIRIDRGPVTLVAAGDRAEAIERLGLLDRGALARCFAVANGPEGRARVAVLPLAAAEERLCLRRVRRGGWLGAWLPAAPGGMARPLAELAATARLADAAAPVPRPLCVVAERGPRGGGDLAFGTVFVENAVDALQFLEARPGLDRLLRAAAAAGSAVRRFHDAGGRHADLHLKNLLLSEDEARTNALVIDLDGARVEPNVSSRARIRELMRLYRSLVKRHLLSQVGPRGCARFFAAYTGGERTLRREMRAGLPRERLRLAVHALHYR